MDYQPTCGCPIPVINPPDLGIGERVPATFARSPLPLPDPANPGAGFPRVMTASAGSIQSTSLACEPAFACGGFDGRHRVSPPIGVRSRYGIDGLDRAEGEIASLLARIHYPVPGIWIGPALIHLPSGNLVLQISAPCRGPFDPVPVFTYNSLAASEKAYYGFGVADLFNPTIEHEGDRAKIITGTGRCLVYSDVADGAWATPPASTRNALKREIDQTWVERQPDGLLWRYNSDGHLVEIASPSGAVWSVSRSGASVTITAPNGRVTSYDASGITQPGSRFTAFGISNDLLTSVTWPDGASLALGYSDEALLTSITDPAGRVTTYDYDLQDRVRLLTTPDNHDYRYDYFQEEDALGGESHWIEVTDPDGQVTTVIHDCNVVQAVVDPLGNRTTYTWEGEGDSRLSGIIDPKGRQTSLSYSTLANKTRVLSSITRPALGVFQFGFGSNDRCNSISDYDGHSTTLDWDAHENRVGTLDAEGGQFTFLYNVDRQVTGTIDPLTHRATITYDAVGNVQTLANELNEVTTFTYNAADDVATVENPEQEVTIYARDAVGRVTAITDPLGHTTSYSYTGDGLIERIENAENETTTYAYSGERRLRSITDPLLHTTTFSYESRGLLATTENAEHEVTTHVHDLAGRPLRTIDPFGHVTTFVHDPAGNPIAVTNPESETTTSVYDDADRVIALIDPLNHVTTTTYNGANLPIAIINPLNETTTTLYDDLYRPTALIDPLGHTTTTTYDPLGRPIAVTNAELGTTTTLYDAAGRPVAITNAELETTTIIHDGAGRPTTVIDPLGHATTTVYDVAGRAIAVVDPLGRTTTTTYDKANRPIALTNARNETTTTIYDAAGRAIAVIDPLLQATTTTYDDANRPTAITNPAGETTTTVYDAAGRAIATINPLAHTVTTTYDAANRPIAVTNAESETTTTLYDAAGRSVAVINPLLYATTTDYDAANRPIAITNAELETTTTVYDAAGRVIAVIDPLGHATTTTYDDADRPVTVTNAENETTTTVHDAAGRVIAIIDPLGRATTTSYDLAGRPIAITNPESETTTTIHDAAGQAIAMINPLGHVTTTVHDNAGRVLSVVNPLGHATTFTHDPAGRLIATIDPLGHATTTLYDGANRPVVTIDPAGQRVTTVYDAAGRTVALINEKGHTTTTLHDKADRVVGTVNPLGQQHTFVYDQGGRQVQRIDARGQITTYVHDSVGRQVGREYADGTRATIIYDQAGNRTSLEDWTGQYAYSHDRANRVVSATSFSGTILYDYDATGQRIGMTDPDGGAFTYTRDLVGRLTRIENPEGEVTTLGYDAAGRNIFKALHNGATAEMAYDAAGNQIQLTNRDASSALLDDHQYVFDKVGRRRAALDETGGYSNWTYDRTGQLTSDFSFASGTLPSWARLIPGHWDSLTVDDWATLPVDAAPSFGFAFVHDPAGNRLTRTDPETGAVTTNTYDAANRLLTSSDANGTTTFTYDANGNQLTIEQPTGDVTTNTWDGENRLVQVEHPDGLITTYAYNADGLKVEADDGTEIARFVYDGNNLLQEKDDIGWVEAEFTYVPQPYAQLVSQRREGESLFHHFDGLRDTRELSDAAGVVTDEYQYDAWGELKSSTGSTANSHTFKGQLLAYRNDPQAGPEQSIYSLHYRDYVASQGRLRSEDPAQDDLNLYRYCHNDPVNRSDPSGLLDLEYTRADKYGQMIVRANEMIVGIRNLKTSSITRTIKVGRTSRNYTVRSTVFSRFVNQIADEQTLEQWTPEDWDNWFRQHDLSVNPAASDYSKAVDLPPRPRYTEPKPTKFDKNSGDLSRYDELVTEANTGDATGDLSQRSGLMPGFMPTATSNGKATQLTMFPIAEAIAELIQLVAIPGEMVSPGGGRQASGAIRSARRSASVTASALDDPTRLAARQVTGDFLDKLEAQLTRRGIRFSRNGRSALKGGKPLADNVGAAVMFDPVQSQMELVLRDDARAFEVIEELIHINDILSLPPQFRKLWGQIPEHRKELSAIYQIMSTPEIWDRLQYAEKIYFIGRLKKYLAIAVKKGEAMGTAVQNIYDPFAGYRTPITRLQ